MVFGQLLAVAGTLISIRVFTELLNPYTYGQLALGLTIATLVSQTVFGPLSNGATRFYVIAVEQNDVVSFLDVIRRQVFYASIIVVFVVLIVVTTLIYTVELEWVGITISALLFALVSGYNSTLSGVQTAARQRTIVALHQGMDAWLRLFVVFVCISYFGPSSVVAITGYAIAIFLVLVSQYLFFHKTIIKSVTGQRKENTWQKQVWLYSWPFAIWGVFYWAQSASDRWALEMFSSMEDVGLYVVLFQLGYYPIMLLSNIVSQFLAPIFYQRAGDASESKRNEVVRRLSLKVTVIILVITGLGFLITLYVHEMVFNIFTSPGYEVVSHLLPWMVLVSGLFSAGQALSLNLMSLMKTHLMMKVKIITGSLAVVFNFCGAYWYGNLGVVFAGLLSSALFFLWMLVLTMKKTNQLVNN